MKSDSPHSLVLIMQDHNDNCVPDLVSDLGFRKRVFTNAGEFMRSLEHSFGDVCAVVDVREFERGIDLQYQALRKRLSIPFVFVINDMNFESITRAFRRGAVSVVDRNADQNAFKDSLKEGLLAAFAFRCFSECGVYYCYLRCLPDRERRIVQLAAQGLPNKRIAAIMGLSVKSVEKQRRHAYRCMRVKSSAEMTRAVVLGNLQPYLRMVSYATLQ